VYVCSRMSRRASPISILTLAVITFQGRLKSHPLAPVETDPLERPWGSVCQLEAAAGGAPGALIGPFFACTGLSRAERRSAGLRAAGAIGLSTRFRLARGWAAAEVAVAEAVAVTLSERISAWWTSRSTIAAAATSSQRSSPGGEGLVACHDQAGALVSGRRRARTSGWRPGVEGDVADLVDVRSGVQSSLRSSSSRRPCRCASPGRATYSVAVAKATRWPVRQARIPSAIARWLLPVRAQEVRAGKRACLIRASPLCASREATSLASSASAKRSYYHSSTRARSASFGSALAAAGAFSVRKRWASSACVLRAGINWS
jgi:hypothetical protein